AGRSAAKRRMARVAPRGDEKRSPKDVEEVFGLGLPDHAPAYQALLKKQGELQQEEGAIKARGPIAHVMQEKPQESMAYVLFRGEYDKRRDPVKPATPHALPPMPAELPPNRLGLAEALLPPQP